MYDVWCGAACDEKVLILISDTETDIMRERDVICDSLKLDTH